MSFQIDELDKLIPPDFTSYKKGKLKDALSQFKQPYSQNDKNYTDFYLLKNYSYFLQADLIREIRFSDFNKKTKQYEKKYYDALLLSNTCDMDENNSRNISKKVLIAKLIPFNFFIESLSLLKIKNTTDILTQVKNQQYSNLFYLPITQKGVDYIAYLDEICWIDLDELNMLKDEIESNKIASLDYFGYYLFVLKLSYHLCRLPEEAHR